MGNFKKLFCLVVFSLIFACTLKLPAAQAAIRNNGGEMVQSDTYVWMIKDLSNSEKNAYQLLRVKLSDNSITTLDSWSHSYMSTDKLWLFNSKLYYQRGSYIYRNNLSKKSLKKLVSGILLGMNKDYIYYCNSTHSSLYRCDLNGENKKRLISGSNYLTLGGVSGDVLIVNNQDESFNNHVVYINMSTGTKKTLFTPEQDYSYQSYAPEVVNIYVNGTKLYYLLGTYQGTLNIFEGNLESISLSGKSRKSIKSADEDYLYKYGSYLYYSSGESITRMNLDTGKSSRISGESWYDVAGTYIYYGDDEDGRDYVSIYRYNAGSKKSTAVLFKKLKKSSSKYWYTIHSVNYINGYVYLNLTVTDYNAAGYGWRGKHMGQVQYKMKSDGSKLKKI